MIKSYILQQSLSILQVKCFQLIFQHLVLLVKKNKLNSYVKLLIEITLINDSKVQIRPNQKMKLLKINLTLN